ncbi:MAG: nucleoside monophosphate kinase [Candidatus Thermoplasmatota archaeon]|nr:nucleoside monophosphate kinase [Candidatus Thermoplasmatota archaeon]
MSIPDTLTNVIVTGKSGAGKQPRIDVLVEQYGLEQLSTGTMFRSYLAAYDHYGYTGSLNRFRDEDNEAFIPDEDIMDELGTDDAEVVLGLKAKYYVERGLYVPDHITNELFQAAFAAHGYRGQALDGYPRTKEQARFLLELVDEQDTAVDFILWVTNTDENIIERTTRRRICPNCGAVYHLDYKPPDDGRCTKCGAAVVQRSDDTEEKIRSRLQEFKTKTLPALHFLQEQGIPIAKVSGHLDEFTEENVRRSVMEALEQIYGPEQGR